MLRIDQLRLLPDQPESDLTAKCARLLRTDPSSLRDLTVLRRAIDAREGLTFVYTVAVSAPQEAALLRRCRDKRVTAYVPEHYVLPADEEYLDAVKNYLDIDAFADAMLCDIRFKVPYIGELIRDTDCPAVEDYNDFAEALEDIWQQDGLLLTYAAVLEAEKPETLHRACELLQDLDNYQRITEGAYGYGQQRLQETLGLDDEAIYELDGYMDFEKYGQDCMENDCVAKTEFGLLRRLDPPFPEQTQGQQMFQ